jgi:hypothetical protein
VRHTYSRHLSFSLLDAAAAAILANAPLMAVKSMAARDWHLALPLLLSSLGMLTAVSMGHWMACQPKKPFVLVPGLGYACSSVGLALAPDAFWFLALLGVGALFEVLTRPALTAIIRLNYPVAVRGMATGEIRKWCSIVFLLVTGTSAAALTHAADPGLMIRAQVAAAGVLSVLAYVCFNSITVREESAAGPAAARLVVESLQGASLILRRDSRYRRYLAGCFLFGFSGLLYVSFIPSFLAHDLGFGYLECALLLHVIPSVASFVCTGSLGAWFDRSNPLNAWAAVRVGWGLDPLVLAAAPLLSLLPPLGQFLFCAFGRVLRGGVMGGSWILWWQIGTNYFAPPGADTARYMGILTCLNGVVRLLAPLAGVVLLSFLPRTMVLLIGGVGVLLSAVLAWAQGREDRARTGFRVFADAEWALGEGAMSEQRAPPRG